MRHDGPTAPVGRSSRPTGFTILELLVSIGIIGVLLAISLPALRNTRASANEVKSLSNARLVAADMAAFAAAFNRWPYARAGERSPAAPTPPGFPGDQAVVPTLPPGAFVSLGTHWDLDRAWAGLVATVAPWEDHFDSWISPGKQGASLADRLESGFMTSGLVSYIYSHSFIASPALWSGGAVADESLIAPTKPSDVAFPSNKVLVWDGDLAYLPRPPRRVEGHWFHPTPTAFADGHAAVRTPADAAPGVANPLNNNNNTRLHNTPDGVLGRDY